MVVAERVTRVFGALLIGCALAACVTLPAPVLAELEPAAIVDEPGASAEAPSPEARAFDAAALPLAPGQIVVSETGDALSLFFSLFTEDYAPWVHAGILAIEDGEPVVYDANGTLLPIPGLSPTLTTRGAIRRVPLARFVRGKRVVGFYSPPAQVDVDRLLAFARAHHAAATPFDPYFDADDAGAFYCTEFVARAFAAAGGAVIEGSPMRANASLAVVRTWLRVRAPRLILAGQLVDGAREAALWSPRMSRAEIDGYFAAKRTVHAQFGSQARLGDVFRWTGSGLVLRERVQALFDERRHAALQAATVP